MESHNHSRPEETRYMIDDCKAVKINLNTGTFCRSFLNEKIVIILRNVNLYSKANQCVFNEVIL